MRETPQHRASRRVVLVARVAFLWAVVVVGRLIHLQVIEHQALSKRAQNQHDDQSALPAVSLQPRTQSIPGNEHVTPLVQ